MFAIKLRSMINLAIQDQSCPHCLFNTILVQWLCIVSKNSCRIFNLLVILLGMQRQLWTLYRLAEHQSLFPILDRSMRLSGVYYVLVPENSFVFEAICACTSSPIITSQSESFFCGLLGVAVKNRECDSVHWGQKRNPCALPRIARWVSRLATSAPSLLRFMNASTRNSKTRPDTQHRWMEQTTRKVKRGPIQTSGWTSWLDGFGSLANGALIVWKNEEDCDKVGSWGNQMISI